MFEEIILGEDIPQESVPQEIRDFAAWVVEQDEEIVLTALSRLAVAKAFYAGLLRVSNEWFDVPDFWSLRDALETLRDLAASNGLSGAARLWDEWYQEVCGQIEQHEATMRMLREIRESQFPE